jgi:hypothetical protein
MLRKLAIAGALLLLASGAAYLFAPAILYPYVDDPPMMPRLEALPEIGSLSAKRCGLCHQEIYREWESSLMGQAMTNPFFSVERAEQHNLFLCGRCHFPLENQEELLVTGLRSLSPLIPEATVNPSFDAALQREGVTCVVCHMRAGSNAILNTRVLEGSAAPHPLEVAKVDAICVRCHDFDPIASKTFRPPLDTFNEHAEYLSRGGTETCTDCHMPERQRASTANGPVRTGHDHRFPGALDGPFIARHLHLEISSDAGGVYVELENKAGHRVPTGEPSRVLRVRIELLSATGEVLASRVLRILRDMDTLEVADRADSTLGVFERRRVRIAFSRGELQSAARARAIVELHRYEPTHQLVQLAGMERFSGFDLVAHVTTATVVFGQNE